MMRSMSSTVTMNIPSTTIRGSDVVEVDNWCMTGVGCATEWVFGFAAKPAADHEYSRLGVRLAPGQTMLETVLTLAVPFRSRSANGQRPLDGLRYFHPGLLTKPEGTVVMARVIDEMKADGVGSKWYAQADELRDTRLMQRILADHSLQVLGALESTDIDVAVLPFRTPDGSTHLVTCARKHQLTDYLIKIETVGIGEGQQYIVNRGRTDVDERILAPWTGLKRPTPRQQEPSREIDSDFDMSEFVIG